MFKYNLLLWQDGASAELAPEIVERLIRRPEDLPSHVTQHIKRYKTNMLRILEVRYRNLDLDTFDEFEASNFC